MKKYQVTIRFEWNEETMQLIPEHRRYINSLIENLILEHYVVSMEAQRLWITINAGSKEEVISILSQSPFSPYWKYDICELIVWDGLNYRLPVIQLN